MHSVPLFPCNPDQRSLSAGRTHTHLHVHQWLPHVCLDDGNILPHQQRLAATVGQEQVLLLRGERGMATTCRQAGKQAAHMSACQHKS